MQRRKFIHITAFSGVVMGTTGISCNQLNPAYSAILDKPETLSQICDMKTLREIGTAYQLQANSEKGQEKLKALLLSDLAGDPVKSDADSQFIQTLIKQKIKRDFESGNTVIVSGWVLAVTEARQCALLSLNPQH